MAITIALTFLMSGLAGCFGGEEQIEIDAELDCDYHGQVLIYLNGKHQNTVSSDCLYGEYMGASGTITVEEGDVIKFETDSDNGMNSCTITVTEDILNAGYGYCTDR